MVELNKDELISIEGGVILELTVGLLIGACAGAVAAKVSHAVCEMMR